MRKMKITVSVLLLIFIFNGCSSKKVKTRFVKMNNSQYQSFNSTNNYNHFRYKPVIGTRQEDTKVMIDMGQFAKIWVKNYRNKNKTFVASHDIITMINEPGFIAGEEIPSSKRRTLKKTYGGNSFSYRSKDILHNSSKNSSLETSQIKNFINNYSESKKYKKIPKSKVKEVKIFDDKIKSFLKKRRIENE